MNHVALMHGSHFSVSKMESNVFQHWILSRDYKIGVKECMIWKG